MFVKTVCNFPNICLNIYCTFYTVFKQENISEYSIGILVNYLYSHLKRNVIYDTELLNFKKTSNLYLIKPEYYNSTTFLPVNWIICLSKLLQKNTPVPHPLPQEENLNKFKQTLKNPKKSDERGSDFQKMDWVYQ